MHKKLHQQGIVDDRIDKPNRDIHGRFPHFPLFNQYNKIWKMHQGKTQKFHGK